MPQDRPIGYGIIDDNGAAQPTTPAYPREIPEASNGFTEQVLRHTRYNHSGQRHGHWARYFDQQVPSHLLFLGTLNLMLLTCLRILVFVKEFIIASEDELYAEVKKIHWEDYFSLEETFAIDSVVSSEKFRHANYMSLKAKDAIVDRFREKYGSRPNVDTRDAALRINIHIRNTTVTLSLDSSGSSLHMRNYRKRVTEAPLNEVLAAGLVLLSGWDKMTMLIDPMCGSGTIICEAARIAPNIPPQDPEREFGSKKWRNFDPVLYQMVVDEELAKVKTSELPEIKGYDISSKAIEYATVNVQTAKLSDHITLSEEDFFY